MSMILAEVCICHELLSLLDPLTKELLFHKTFLQYSTFSKPYRIPVDRFYSTLRKLYQNQLKAEIFERKLLILMQKS